jgi:hypothetical protein
MTYKEYSNFPLSSSGMVCPASLYMYVATTAAGVFFTDSYVDEGTQPVWVDVSAGLPALDCNEFHIDPFDPTNRQYVLLKNSNEKNTLHRRVNGGAWEEILNCTDAATLCVCDDTDSFIAGFCLNPTIPGKIWATFGSNNVVEEPNGYWALYSDDYGDTWNISVKLVDGIFTYGLGTPVAYDDYIFVPLSNFAGGAELVYYSVNGGGAWASQNLGANFTAQFGYNILIPERVYAWASFGGGSFWMYDAGGVPVDLFSEGHLRGDAQWFDPVLPNTQRYFGYVTYNLKYTTDNWTNELSTDVNFSPYAFNPIDINGEILCTISLDHAGHQHHCIAVLTDVTDVNPVGIAGTNCDTAPFTDSIPDTCGAVCLHGLQAFMA